jgi:hypothetical protein
MKLVVLVDSNTRSFERMVELVNEKDILIIDTEKCDRPHEYEHLITSIAKFSESNNEIMLGKFSGNENIVKELGDECSEMIVALSSNKNNRHYTEKLVDTFLNLIQAFEKETISA